jgi:hypothetical protein
MRPRSSNLPQVGLVFARQVILEKAHQVLEYVHVLAPAAHDAKSCHEHGAVLGGEFVPVPLAGIGDEAAPAFRRAISVVVA